MSSDQQDKFARVTSILALLIALGAVAVPYWQQSSQFEAQQRENLNVLLNSTVNGPLRLTGHNFGEMGQVVQMPWKLIVSNTGNRQLSIINKRISFGETPDSQYYTGIDGGIFTQGYKPIDLPIKLEAGESQSYYIYVGAIVPAKVYEILYGLNEGKPVMDREAMKALGEEGIDIYGNPVKYLDHGNDKFLIEFKSVDKSPTFWVNLFTGGGNRFYGAAAKYSISPESVL
ncbi:MAG: hypothetical protein RPV21_18050 [Candidatus Sedimenticola sp. (ex Thyasira tokunagai)]